MQRSLGAAMAFTWLWSQGIIKFPSQSPNGAGRFFKVTHGVAQALGCLVSGVSELLTRCDTLFLKHSICFKAHGNFSSRRVARVPGVFLNQAPLTLEGV